MMLPLFILLAGQFAWAQTSAPAESPKTVDPLLSYNAFIESPKFNLSRADVVVAEHIVNLLKLIDKGYINDEVLSRTASALVQSKNFKIFKPWLDSVKQVSKLKKSSELITFCADYSDRREKLSIERSLERKIGNYCRERALEAISRDLAKEPKLTEEMKLFLQQHLKYFLVKKNRQNFAYFIQSISGRQELLREVSQLVTAYSVAHQLVPGQEVLKDIVINEQITKLIQEKGFNPLQHKNVFYAEYSTLIQAGYRTLDKSPDDKKVQAHFKFLKNYIELNQDHLPVGLCLSRLNDFAKSVYRGGFANIAREMYRYIIGKKNSEIQEDAFFFYFWTFLDGNDFKTTLKTAESFNLTSGPEKVSDPRLKFWLAYAFEKTDKPKEALRFYEDVVNNNPLSYYSIMSVKKIQQLNPASPAVAFYPTNAAKVQAPISLSHEDLSDDHLASLVRLRAWSRIDSLSMIKLELNRLNNHTLPELLKSKPADKQLALKSDLHIVNARLIQLSQNYLATFRYLYSVMDKKEIVFNRALLEILYPQPFLDDLSKALKNDRLDPLIVLSLIRQESVFNPLARSPVGARGLMQLMPATARRLRRSVTTSHLTNPKVNIELGTKYFKNLVKRYDGNLVYVLSAYNAGESRVTRWQNQYWNSDDTILKNIEAIPFLETRNYVKLIFRNIFFYKLLQDKTELADTDAFNKIYDVSLGFKH